MDLINRSREEINEQIRFILRTLSDTNTPEKQGRRIVLLEALAIHVEGLMALTDPTADEIEIEQSIIGKPRS